jgi:[acyl-carrier-protein] S-malonyltransferase
LMTTASDELAGVLADVTFHAPSAPVVSNHDGVAYDDADGWRARLAEHVIVPVRWRVSMETLAHRGADAFVEVGYGSMIAGVAKRTVPEILVLPCGSPAECAEAIS